MTTSEIADRYLAALHSSTGSFDSAGHFDEFGVDAATRAAVLRMLFDGGLIAGVKTESWVAHDYHIIDPAITIAGIRRIEAKKAPFGGQSIQIGSIANSQVAIGDHNQQSVLTHNIDALTELVEALSGLDVSELDAGSREVVQLNAQIVREAADGGVVEPGRLRAALLTLRSVAGKLSIGAGGKLLAEVIEPLVGI